MTLPQHDEIHIISDLHMGGTAGFQILGETRRLAAFIRWVAKQRPEGRVALILNGDVIDMDENRTKLRREGMYAGINSFITKQFIWFDHLKLYSINTRFSRGINQLISSF